jgi:hypothetical protein
MKMYKKEFIKLKSYIRFIEREINILQKVKGWKNIVNLL